MAERVLLDDPNQKPPLVTFVRESRVEMTKVDWPDRKTTRNLTIVVIALSAIMAAVLGTFDLLLTYLYNGLQTLFGV
ncbi:MAG: preprotein translocase subunit SecE [Chloroflexota bacterium]|nr:preprotein translocase subunit SecE [Chloroflexota bacterium]